MASRHAFGFPFREVALRPRGVNAAGDTGQNGIDEVRTQEAAGVFAELERPTIEARVFPHERENVVHEPRRVDEAQARQNAAENVCAQE